MATKVQVKKAVVERTNGKIDRAKTIQVLLENFGPMTDDELTTNLQRVDETATIQNTQWSLYQLRRAGVANKADDGNWSV